MPTYNQLKESRRVHEGIFGSGVPFMETPKYSDELRFDSTPKKYMLRIGFILSWEKWELIFNSLKECEYWINELDLKNDKTVASYDVI